MKSCDKITSMVEKRITCFHKISNTPTLKSTTYARNIYVFKIVKTTLDIENSKNYINNAS